MNDSVYFDRSASFLDISIGKYRKSSLTEARKEMILKNIILEFEARQYFLENLASLSGQEISEMVGYNSKTAFNNVFKKLTEKTPSEFRKSAS